MFNGSCAVCHGQDGNKREAELAMQEALALEKAELADARQSLLKSQLAEYVGQVRATVERYWLRPRGTPKGLKCTVRVTQIPDGSVINVTVVRSSNNVAFDNSVVAAVRKSSPLPLPKDKSLFSRELIFEFTPKD